MLCHLWTSSDVLFVTSTLKPIVLAPQYGISEVFSLFYVFLILSLVLSFHLALSQIQLIFGSF